MNIVGKKKKKRITKTLVVLIYCVFSIIIITFLDNKQRLKGFNPIQRSIPCAAFNAQGNLFAYASSYDWSKGSSFHSPGDQNEIYIHYTPDTEIKPKNKR